MEPPFPSLGEPQPQLRETSHCSPTPVLATLSSLCGARKVTSAATPPSNLNTCPHTSTRSPCNFTTCQGLCQTLLRYPGNSNTNLLSLTCTTSVTINCAGSSQVGRFKICSSPDRPQPNQTTSSAREPTFYQSHLNATRSAAPFA